MPYLPLSDNDISAIDENDDDLANRSGNSAESSGKISTHLIMTRNYTLPFFAQYSYRWTGIRKGDITRHREDHDDTVRRNESSTNSRKGYGP